MPGAGARYFKNVGDIRLDSIVISYKAFCWILYCNFFFLNVGTCNWSQRALCKWIYQWLWCIQ